MIDEPVEPARPPEYAPSPTVDRFIKAIITGPPDEMRVLILRGPRGTGKAMPIDAPVLTPHGWVKIGDIKVGDLVVAKDGRPAPVLGVYPQGVQPLRQVRFSDGTSLVATPDHLWTVLTQWDRDGRAAGDTRRRGTRAKQTHPDQWRGAKVVPTQLLEERLRSGAWQRGGRWEIPLVDPVELPRGPTPIDPYLLGLLLGDGGLTDEGVAISTTDDEILASVRRLIPAGTELRHWDRCTYRIAATKRSRRPSGQWQRDHPLLDALRGLGLLGRHAQDKFVPDVYLWNAVSTRLAILQGLLDTDGTVSSRDNSITFCSTSERLVEAVEFLVRSLGGVTRRGRPRRRTYRYRGELRRGRPSWNVTVTLPDLIQPFRLSRKLRRLQPHQRRGRPARFIVGVEPLEPGPVVCIEVDHPDGCFVASEFVVTHNTTGGIWACCALADRIAKDGVPLPLRVGVVRDTWENLNRTTLVSFDEWRQQGLEIAYLNGKKEAIIGPADSPSVHFWFFGLDQADDADKLQGFMCGAFWLEEVAPAAGVATGVPASALGLGATSVRQNGVPPRIIITMNPPDKNHWILKVEQHLRDAGLTHVRVRHFVMDAREKSAHFLTMAQLEDDPLRAKAWKDAAVAFERYTARNRVFLESVGRKDLVARLVEGEIGEVRLGAAVVPNFSRRLHVAGKPLQIVRGVEIVRGWDSGVNDLHPACAWIQCGPDWFNVLGSRVGTNMSLEEFIRTEVWPFEKKYGITKARPSLRGAGGARGGFSFRNIGDPAMFSSDGRGSRTAALIIESLMHESVEPGPVEWTARREAAFAGFQRKGGGDRMFVQIDPEENDVLIDGLAGRFHYPENKQTNEIIGDIAAAKRASGIYSHPVDAIIYPLCVLYPAQDWMREQMVEKAPGGPPASWMTR